VIRRLDIVRLARVVAAAHWIVMAMAARAEDYWAMPAAKRAEVVKTAAFERQGGGGWVTAKGMPVVTAQLARWDELPAREAGGYAIQVSALLEAYGFKGAARVYSAYALARLPDDDVALSNYAAISCHPPFLRAAAGVSPKSPVVHTNLGSCAMSARRWELAREAYEKALALNDKHVNALLGMGQWWLAHGDVGKAAEFYVRAKRFRVLRKKRANAASEEEAPPELRPPPRDRFQSAGAEPPSASTEEGGTARVTDTTLRLPDLPRWSGPDAFIASAAARKPLAEFYGRAVGLLFKAGVEAIRSDPLKQIRDMEARLAAMTAEEQELAKLEGSLRKPWDDASVLEGMEENDAWLKKKLKTAEAEFKRATAERKELGRKVNLIQRQMLDRFQAACPKGGGARSGSAGATLEAAARCAEAFRESAIDTCLQARELNVRSFVLWRDAYRAWYEAVREPIERYYQVQGLWIRQIADEQVWRTALKGRDAVVFTPLWSKMVQEDVERIGVAGMAAATFGATAEVCPREPPRSPEPEAPPELPKTDEPKRSCPLKAGQSIKIPPGDIPGLPLSFEITCEDAKMTLSYGLGDDDVVGPAGAAAVLSLTHHFGTDKSTTLYVGLQGSLNMTVVGASSVGVTGEIGASFDFDRNGQPTGGDFKASLTDSARVAGGWGGDGSAALTAVIEKGAPDVRMEASGSPFGPGG
jgi:tetratricopeptide (TPR) repeat protein